MPIFDIDLTKADVVDDGDYVATIKSVTPKASKDGESTNFNWLLTIPSLNGRTIFHSTNSKLPNMIKSVMDAAKAVYEKTGFDPTVAVGAQVNIRVTTREDEYGIKNVIAKIWAV